MVTLHPGAIYQHMYTTRAAFKQAFRYCRKQKEQLKADACAQSLANKDGKRFWKNVSKIASKKLLLVLTKLVTVLRNLRSVICGEITSTSYITNDSKNIFDSKCASSTNNSCVTVKEVMGTEKSEICWSQWAGHGSVYICWFEVMDTFEFVLLVLY